MLCGGVAACHRYGMCTARCVECMVWQHVIDMVCVLFAVLSATSYTCRLIEFWICCQIPLKWCTHSRCILYNRWLKFCFLQYRNLISWFNLYLIALVVVLLSCGFLPLILMLMYLGLRCLILHILLNHTVVFVFNNLSLVFLLMVESFACTKHNKLYTYHKNDMPPHHRITYNDVVFIES